MGLKLVGHVELPENRGTGGFDHADIHVPTNRLYVAHTSNDALDIIDTGSSASRSAFLRAGPAAAIVDMALSGIGK